MSNSTPTPDGVQSSSKLSPADFRIYNRLAERMDLFHNNFRQSWTILYNACTSKRRPKHLSIHQFLTIGLDLCAHLEVHHAIEEQSIFPHLAQRMPAFRKGVGLIDQHRQIHAGLEKLNVYLEECKGRERELRLEELKAVMDGFGDVLWRHLDEEVRELGAEEMSKYWSLEEMRRMPM
ncbi:hypothetical protein D8B26_002245 [Coccidioides posadasii str. Silveira]|uniref:Hemerythrin-like domain-containing protein n=3 Tax=Coccidioides posadasii TaxID=199306 RepID=E9DDE3_COCPS|nr:hypothetical protein CPC735_054400 [Coccidioides posadasii C735 delta SOWgp]EER24070.1 hypothetical protein CPC735_054400 [Coccidioides posadasii C735 delta SOWgp]EFW15668.1 conserved hypothetical protein [Coccidioides posadasii str. Silveira]KMM65643.1 hypothetical protein CPAG_01989 [Coccidioides posadasii RMSCC 3488]QVM07547.1 hypothetical protein D8B26_002245 [Coccidioides posadasii str. Silveira]|eukprot:XP_003066215.1 hypothetical protein CPC735_054400 [Coccidioides posadasii C735 delta SOWgp]